MKNYPQHLKNKLKAIIKKMSTSLENFVRNPLKDFIRKRKLHFEDIINLLLSINGNSLSKELLDYFQYDPNTASTSAFVQQRSKILPEALKYLFEEFTASYKKYKTFNGYRLIAVDGSKINIPHNEKDLDTYVKGKTGARGHNLVNLNVLYDLENKLYIAATIEPIKKHNERQALINMIDNSNLTNKTLLVADRGYEGYNVFAHLQEKGWKYVIRIRDNDQNAIAKSLNLPIHKEFDEEIKLKITRRQTNKIKANPHIYKFLPQNSNFDYLKDKKDYYEISFRLVRFKISENTYETLITNTNKIEFSSEALKKIYHMRWGIETSFRELKYAIGLVSFHSKKMDFIIQEIFAKLTMYNFCEMITLNVIITQKQSKYMYQVNFTMAIHICKHFFKILKNKKPLNVEELIQRNILPVRPGRQAKRNIKPHSSVSFIYRVA